MKGKGVFREHSRCRGSSEKKVKGTPSNVVVIDLDSDNVFVIDNAESSPQKFQSSSVPREGRKFSLQGIINIDDDDDNDVDPEICVDADGDLVSDASSSKSRFPAFKTMLNSVPLDADECEVIQEKTSAFQFSKCKQTYCTKASGRNRYGLDPAFGNGSTDSDCSDSELMEDAFGVLHEQWERASLKRKHMQNRHCGFEDQSSASGSSSEVRTNAEKENCREHVDIPVCSSSSNADCRKENPSEFFASNGSNVESTFQPQSNSSFVDADQKVEQESFSRWKPVSGQETESSSQNMDVHPAQGSVAGDGPFSFETQSYKDVDGISGFWNEESSPQGSFQPEGDTVVEDPHYSYGFQNKNVCDGIPGLQREEEPSRQRSPFVRSEQDVGDAQCKYPSTRAKEKEKRGSGQSFVSNFKLFDEAQVDNGVALPDDKDGPVEVSLCDSTSNITQIKQVESCSEEAKEPNSRKKLLYAQGNDVTPAGDIISEREKMKETDEYKQAIEEEWASRKRELQIQAEEAQRLRKRRKAENMLKYDIERRQKQRVEEVRETQKKDEENINLKEQLRCEIMKEITKLEMTCIDMASLLRGLGIQVRGGFNPMSRDVHSAYKQALLKFHPDRASKTDIRQQVEAEEKFKLISRMKEKFLSTSWY